MPADSKPPNHSRPTFLFTDIVDSSRMATALGHTAYTQSLQNPHDNVLRNAIEKYHGYIDGTAGDSFLVAFARVEEAIHSAQEIQQNLLNSPITETDSQGEKYTLAVRIGIHTAEAEVWKDPDTGYRGQPDVNFAARVMSQADAGQVLLSESAWQAAGKGILHQWHEWPDRWVKSFEDAPQTLYEFLWDGGETRGEPGQRWLPLTFRTENDVYIQRPELQARVLRQFAKPKKGGVSPRMVTLWGFGGMGKTRLSIACALRSVGLFKDGVYFISLAERIPSAQSVVEAIGGAMDFHTPASLDDLLPSLREKNILLVLDNYESVHCEEVQKLLRDLLLNTRNLRLLMTGREASHLPPLEKQIEVSGLTDSQANELFISRARLMPGRDEWQPSSNAEAEALARILKLTGCHPLALELVAAQMGRREISEIAAELEKTPLPALPKGHLHGEPSIRHQSLERCLDYTWNLLDDELKRPFACLSLFADSFGAEALEGVCGRADAQDVLDHLYEKSLITRLVDVGVRGRYSLLRPTRAYAAIHFDTLTDLTELRSQYIAYYCKFVVENSNINDLAKVAELERESRNAIAASEYAAAIDDFASVDYLSSNLGDFLLLRGQWSERERLNLRSLTSARRAGEREMEGRALGNLGIVYESQGRWEEAVDCFNQIIVIFQDRNDRRSEGKALNNLGMVYDSQGRWEEAIDCYAQSLVTFRELGDKSSEGVTLNNLGAVYDSQGRWEEAIDCYAQSLVIKREFGDRVGEGKTLNNLGMVYDSLGRWQEAIDNYEQSLHICREYGDRMGEGQTLNNLGIVYKAQDRWQEAIDCYSQSLVIRREFGDRVGEGKTIENIALVYDAQGDTTMALEWERQALGLLETSEDTRAIERAREIIAEWERDSRK